MDTPMGENEPSIITDVEMVPERSYLQLSKLEQVQILRLYPTFSDWETLETYLHELNLKK